MPSTIPRCPFCGVPTTDTGARGCTAPHGALVRPTDREALDRYMTAAENHALREARLRELQQLSSGERS